MKQQNFISRFKDKITYTLKHGWKETIQSTIKPEDSTIYRVRSQKDTDMMANQSNNKNKQFKQKQRYQFKKKMSSDVEMPIINLSKISRKSSIGGKMSIFPIDNGKHTKKMSTYSQKQRANTDDDHYNSYQENPSFQNLGMTRNYEIQRLKLKLRKSERQKYEQTQVPKFIDLMIKKHDNVFENYNVKAKRQISSKNTNRNSSQRQTIIMNPQEIEEQQNWKRSRQRVIKLKKITQLIDQTNKNRQNKQLHCSQVEETNKSSIVFASLKRSRHFNYSMKKPKQILV